MNNKDVMEILNVIATPALLAVVVYFIKRWMHVTELSVSKTAKDLSSATAEYRKEIAALHEKSHTEVREAEEELIGLAKENRQSIKELVNQVRIANGRTGHLETELTRIEGVILTQSALCKQRNEGRRITDRCDAL